MPRAHVRAVRASIDVGCFFTKTVPRAIVRHLIRYPLDPLPVTRARLALSRPATPARTDSSLGQGHETPRPWRV
jgi:hypothetical protein